MYKSRKKQNDKVELSSISQQIITYKFNLAMKKLKQTGKL